MRDRTLTLRPRARAHEGGFSFTELIVVVGIMMLMAAVGLPAISRYIKNYQINGAAQQVLGAVTTARSKAVMKNVNYGVLFVVTGPNTYRVVNEDVPGATTRTALATLLTNSEQSGAVLTLPGTVRFGTGTGTTTAGCSVQTISYEGGVTTTAFVGNDRGFRFNNLGRWCDPHTSDLGTQCATALDQGLANAVMNDATAGGVVCLTQDTNGDGTPDLRRVVQVTQGGRVTTR